jgi:hypothetical protein
MMGLDGWTRMSGSTGVYYMSLQETLAGGRVHSLIIHHIINAWNFCSLCFFLFGKKSTYALLKSQSVLVLIRFIKPIINIYIKYIMNVYCMINLIIVTIHLVRSEND